MRRFLCGLLTLVVIFLFGCSDVKSGVTFDTFEYADYYKEIPGVTQEEIDAIEKIKSNHKALVLGMPEGISCFRRDDSTLNGFSVMEAVWLTELFDIPFTPRLYEWDQLIAGVYSGEIHFTGAFSPTQDGKITSTNPIQERAVIAVTRATDPSLIEQRRLRDPVYGVINDSGIEWLLAASTVGAYQPKRYPNYQSAYIGLIRREIDALMVDDDAEAVFSSYAAVKMENASPAVYNQVGLATGDPTMSPIISVLQKYLDIGAAYKLSELSENGRMAYLNKMLYTMLNEEERAYMELHQNPAAVIPVALDSDNYPTSFYNEKEQEWQGISNDVLTEIEKITGFTFSSVNSINDNWDTVFSMLENGTVAFVSELIKTPAREGHFLWTDTAWQVDYYALLSTTELPDINIGQVNNLRVGLLASSAYAEMFYELFPNHRNTIIYDGNDEIFKALIDGEIDLYMATRNVLLNAVNYMEMTGIKANLVLNRSYELSYGFNASQGVLCSIMSKAQSLLDIEDITDRWIRRVFDYRGKMARSQQPYLIAASVMLVLVMLLFATLFLRNRQMSKRLEQTVNERTMALLSRTEELEAQTRRAEIASQAKSDFLSRMSHEIRTPLNAIIGMTRIAQGAAENKKTTASLKQISAASDHLLGILNDVLDMSKIESGKFILSEEPFQLRQAMMEVENIIRQRCDEKYVAFEINFQDMQNCSVLGDKLRLKQVLINLLGNAVKFTRVGGSISFLVDVLEEDETKIVSRFSVKDSGIGMTKEQIGKLFTPFEQTDSNISAHYGGTGLGLAISQTLVGYMGGVITVESQPNEGSLFAFTLTLPKVASIADNLDRVDETYPDLTGKRILIVDDVDINRLILKELLADTHVMIEEASDGKLALGEFDKSKDRYFDLILMDIQMPEMNGYMATAAIRALERPDAKTVPIIAMTANAYKEDIEQALKSGMNDHLAKPVDLDMLMRALKSFLCTPDS